MTPRGCSNGANCKFAHESPVTDMGMRSRSAPSDQNNAANRTKPVCKFFQTARGCNHGANCKFAHSSPAESKPTTTQQQRTPTVKAPPSSTATARKAAGSSVAASSKPAATLAATVSTSVRKPRPAVAAMAPTKIPPASRRSAVKQEAEEAAVVVKVENDYSALEERAESLAEQLHTLTSIKCGKCRQQVPVHAVTVTIARFCRVCEFGVFLSTLIFSTGIKLTNALSHHNRYHILCIVVMLVFSTFCRSVSGRVQKQSRRKQIRV